MGRNCGEQVAQLVGGIAALGRRFEMAAVLQQIVATTLGVHQLG